jgi:hypothetical protein
MSDQELMRDGERWRAFAAASDWADKCKRVACASCECANASPVRFVDPYTARVEPWYVTGDIRVFVFVCDECAAAADEYDARNAFYRVGESWFHCGATVRGSVAGDSFAECRICDAVIEWSELPGVES